MEKTEIDKTTIGKEYLIKLIREISECSTKILESGSIGDENKTRIKVDLIRQLKANLYNINQDTKNGSENYSEKEKIDIQSNLNIINSAENFINAWSKRYQNIMSTNEMVGTEEGINILIDQSLPLIWDWERDIVILSGANALKIKNTLEQRGQTRIALIEKEKDQEIKDENSLNKIHNRIDAFNFLAPFRKKPPLRVANIRANLENGTENEKKLREFFKERENDINNAWRAMFSNKNTIEYFGDKWVKHGIQNLPSIVECPEAKLLSQKLKGKTFVIVSPGPSLDKNINQLKAIEGKAILIAPAQSVKALYLERIRPDIVVIADPSDMEYCLNEIPYDYIGLFFLGVSCHPSLYKKYKDRILTFNVNTGIDNWISDIFKVDNDIGSGGSVSVGIFNMACTFEASAIILVGQDLAFTDGKAYSSNAADGGLKLEFNQEQNTFIQKNYSEGLIKHTDNPHGEIGSLKAPGYYGGEVTTRHVYDGFRIEFEVLAESIKQKNPKIKLFNCTEGGVYIKGFDHITLNETIRKLEKELTGIGKTKEILFELKNNINILDRRKKLKKYLKDNAASIEKIKSLNMECIQLVNKYKKYNLYDDALNEKEKKLIKSVRKSHFLSIAFQTKIQEASNLGEKATGIKESFDASMLLYSVLTDAVERYEPLIKNAIEELIANENQKN